MTWTFMYHATLHHMSAISKHAAASLIDNFCVAGEPGLCEGACQDGHHHR